MNENSQMNQPDTLRVVQEDVNPAPEDVEPEHEREQENVPPEQDDEGVNESDMELDLLAESESDSESNHSNQDNTVSARNTASAGNAGPDGGSISGLLSYTAVRRISNRDCQPSINSTIGIVPFIRLPENRLLLNLAPHLILTIISAKTGLNQSSISCNLLFIIPHTVSTSFQTI